MQLTKIMHRHLLTIEPSKLCFLLLAQSTHSETTQVGIALGPAFNITITAARNKYFESLTILPSSQCHAQIETKKNTIQS